MSFRKLVTACSLLGAASAGVLKKDASPPTVTLQNGTYSGVYNQEYDQDFFLGMRYAQPAARFTQSQPLNSTWDGTQEATAYPPSCVGYGSDDIGYELAEDCLFLNVIRPAGIAADANLPVLTWIHGGGLYMGGSSDKRYNLTFIVENSVKMGTPIVAVSLNYRLSVFGFIAGEQAKDAGVRNLGYYDQRQALRWIKENIAAFGGNPDHNTIWGESAGAWSIYTQVQAYGGRDDGLFVGAAANSGFGGYTPSFVGGLNNTDGVQEVFDNLVRNTSCAEYVGTADAIPCLREVDFEEINTAVNVTGVGPFIHVKDDDLIQTYPANALRDGQFVKVPILIGANSDEGTAFGSGIVDTDEDLAEIIKAKIPSNPESGKTADQAADELLYVYPDVQSVGIPNLASFPDVITEGSELAEELGLQYRRRNALIGDLSMHYIRRRANIAWSNWGVPSYSWRFDVTVNGVAPYIAATHFQEVAFVFNNLEGLGYTTNPFENTPQSYKDLSQFMSEAWISFVVSGNPNHDGSALAWPMYNTTSGGGVGQNIVFSANGTGSYIEYDDYRAAGMNWWIENSLDLFSN